MVDILVYRRTQIYKVAYFLFSIISIIVKSTQHKFSVLYGHLITCVFCCDTKFLTSIQPLQIAFFFNFFFLKIVHNLNVCLGIPNNVLPNVQKNNRKL